MKIFVPFAGNVSDDSGGRNYAQSFIAEILSEPRGHEWIVVVDPEFFKLLPKVEKSPSVQILPLPTWSRSSTGKVIFEQTLLAAQIAKSGAQAVFFPNNFACVMTSKPYVLAIRSTVYYHYPEQVTMVRRLTRKVITAMSARRANAIVCPSSDISKDVAHFIGVPQEKVSVVPHGINPAYLKPYAPESASVLKRLELDGRTFFVYPSALWAYKNQLTLIRAFELLSQLSPQNTAGAVLVLAGKGIASEDHYVQQLHEAAQKVKAPWMVCFAGHLSPGELNVLYSHAVATLFPSTYESFGNPVVESMSKACPVVVSDRHALPEILGKGGVVVQATDGRAWADVIRRLMDDSELRSQLSRAAFERSKDFSFKNAVDKVSELLRSVVQSQKKI